MTDADGPLWRSVARTLPICPGPSLKAKVRLLPLALQGMPSPQSRRAVRNVFPRRFYCAVQPPSSAMACAVMLRAASLMRNSAEPASSSISMKRPLGMGLSIMSLTT